MFRISIIENDHGRHAILEGKPVASWSNELKNIGHQALSDRDHHCETPIPAISAREKNERKVRSVMPA